MKVWNTIAAAAAGAALFSGCASDGDSAKAEQGADRMVEPHNATLDAMTGEAEVIGVAMHADWCGACQTLGPKVTEAMRQLDDDRVHPVATSTLASFGLSGLEELNDGKTGVLYLVDAQTGEVLGRIGGSVTVEQIRAQLAEALATATG